MNRRYDNLLFDLDGTLTDPAEGITRSPQFLRELILNGQRKGLSAKQIARNAGLSVDEVELIMSQNS